MAQLHWAPDGTPRGSVLLIHGFSSCAGTWWQIGPALAERGWAVTAVDQLGHGGGTIDPAVPTEALADHIAAQVDGAPDVLVGHSLGTVTAMLLAERWRDRLLAVVLEEPPGVIDDRQIAAVYADQLEENVRLANADPELYADAVREANPRWAPDDVRFDVEGLRGTDVVGYARVFRQFADGTRPVFGVAAHALGTRPVPTVLLAPEGSFLEHGSALVGAERAELLGGLPEERVTLIDGGHCLHRDAPDAWLAAFDAGVDAAVPTPGPAALP